MSAGKRFGQRKMAVVRSDVGSYFVPEVSFRVVDISRTNIPSEQGTVLSDVFRSYADARAALEALLGHKIYDPPGCGWGKKWHK